MTDPYTRDDLIAEAARQHHELTRDPDYMGVGESMGTIASTGKSWEKALVIRDTDDAEDLGDWDAYDEAQRAIHDLINHAADVSRWAVTLGTASLEPHEPFAWTCHDDYEVAVQVATSPLLEEDAREELWREIRAAVEQTVQRVLGRKPVAADGGAQGGDDRA